jgi:hypothetical protein
MHWLSFDWPPSGLCCESSVILDKLLGQTLREEQSLSSAGNPARDLFADIPKRGGVVRCRLILTAENRLIELMYAGPPGTEASESVTYFINSLVILN